MNPSTALPPRPVPPPSELSRPYWEAAQQGRLVLQCCAACDLTRHYPRLLCSACYSDQCVWKAASGRGTVHSWTVSHHAFHPAFVAELPYTLVTVDLEEGVRALGRWQEGPSPAIGQAVLGVFRRSEGGLDFVFSLRHP